MTFGNPFGLVPLDPATIHQLCDTNRALPRPALEGFTKAFRKRRHHDWIEVFLVQHSGLSS